MNAHLEGVSTTLRFWLPPSSTVLTGYEKLTYKPEHYIRSYRAGCRSGTFLDPCIAILGSCTAVIVVILIMVLVRFLSNSSLIYLPTIRRYTS
jgi:hypothetical protein